MQNKAVIAMRFGWGYNIGWPSLKSKKKKFLALQLVYVFRINIMSCILVLILIFILNHIQCFLVYVSMVGSLSLSLSLSLTFADFPWKDSR